MSINGLNWRDGKTIHKMSSVNATDYKTTAVCLGTKTIAKKPPPLPAMVALNMFEGMNPIAAILSGKDKERKKKRNKNFRKGRKRNGTSTSNPFLCAADFFLQLGSSKEAVR